MDLVWRFIMTVIALYVWFLPSLQGLNPSLWQSSTLNSLVLSSSWRSKEVVANTRRQIWLPKGVTVAATLTTRVVGVVEGVIVDSTVDPRVVMVVAVHKAVVFKLVFSISYVEKRDTLSSGAPRGLMLHF
jgi:hypothetical protein